MEVDEEKRDGAIDRAMCFDCQTLQILFTYRLYTCSSKSQCNQCLS